MKMPIKESIKRFWLILPITLAALVWTVGCAGFVHHPDPLVGWKIDFNQQPSQAIVKDYENYIQELPNKERNVAHINHFYKDGAGQHAITIIIGLNGVWWRHVLIYDKNDKRIKTVKYSTGGYRS